MVKLVIITGVAGAGKTLAMQAFEEAGYFITDNIPVSVVDGYFNEISNDPKKYSKVALSVKLENAEETFALSKKYKGFDVQFVGLTCSSEILNQRYRLTRKIHPKQTEGLALQKCIDDDIESVRRIRDLFDLYFDTSKLSKNDFRNLIYDLCIGAKHKFAVNFYSFGYKVSVPQDIETVFDVRLLPNPYWVPELKNLTGLDKEVKDFVLNAPETREYLKHIIKYLDFYLEELKKNQRNHASIGFACSGGQHRSVVIAEYLAQHYSKKYVVIVKHKDLAK